MLAPWPSPPSPRPPSAACSAPLPSHACSLPLSSRACRSRRSVSCCSCDARADRLLRGELRRRPPVRSPPLSASLCSPLRLPPLSGADPAARLCFRLFGALLLLSPPLSHSALPVPRYYPLRLALHPPLGAALHTLLPALPAIPSVCARRSRSSLPRCISPTSSTLSRGALSACLRRLVALVLRTPARLTVAFLSTPRLSPRGRLRRRPPLTLCSALCSALSCALCASCWRFGALGAVEVRARRGRSARHRGSAFPLPARRGSALCSAPAPHAAAPPPPRARLTATIAALSACHLLLPAAPCLLALFALLSSPPCLSRLASPHVLAHHTCTPGIPLPLTIPSPLPSTPTPPSPPPPRPPPLPPERPSRLTRSCAAPASPPSPPRGRSRSAARPPRRDDARPARRPARRALGGGAEPGRHLPRLDPPRHPHLGPLRGGRGRLRAHPRRRPHRAPRLDRGRRPRAGLRGRARDGPALGLREHADGLGLQPAAPPRARDARLRRPARPLGAVPARRSRRSTTRASTRRSCTRTSTSSRPSPTSSWPAAGCAPTSPAPS